jgi:hypothetical protein
MKNWLHAAVFPQEVSPQKSMHLAACPHYFIRHANCYRKRVIEHSNVAVTPLLAQLQVGSTLSTARFVLAT